MRLLPLLNTKLLIVPILFVAGLLLQVNETKAQTTKEIQFKKKQFDKTEKDSPISVTLKINTQQPLSNQGLKFTIIFRNLTNKPFTLYDPLGVLRARLVDKDGGDVIILRDPECFVPFSSLIAQIESFDGRTLVDGRMERIDHSETENITIPANDTYEIDLATKTVLINGTKSTSTIEGDNMHIIMTFPNAIKAPLSKGGYKLNMSIVILNREKTKLLYNQILEIPETVLSYGL